MTAFFHGVKTHQIPTAIIPPRRSMSALPFVLGCAPIHRLSPELREQVKPGKIALLYSLAEAGIRFGIDVNRDDFTHWTLSEFAYSEFVLFNVAPCVFANLFDPDKHKKQSTGEEVALVAGRGKLRFPDVIDGVTLSPVDGGGPYSPTTDYALNAVTGEIAVLEDGALADVDRVAATYSYAAPELVTVDECVGGYDVVTGVTTGISLIDEVFPRFRNVPGVALAPKFGEDPVVAAILSAKVASVNGIFRTGIALCDMPSDGPNAIKQYTEVPEYKQKNNLVSEDLCLFWPKVKFGDRVIRMSTQAAGIIAQVDASHNDIPYASPSNKNLQMTACMVGDHELWLGVEQANYLGSNGILTALNHQDGWKLWGNRTACYPDVTDTKDTFITARRMMAWYGNHLIQTWWQMVDFPMTKRMVETMINSETIFLNSLVAGEYLHGGRIAFLSEENALTDLIDGIIKFHVYLGIIPPAENIQFTLELDTSYILTLYSAVKAAAS